MHYGLVVTQQLIHEAHQAAPAIQRRRVRGFMSLAQNEHDRLIRGDHDRSGCLQRMTQHTRSAVECSGPKGRLDAIDTFIRTHAPLIPL